MSASIPTPFNFGRTQSNADSLFNSLDDSDLGTLDTSGNDQTGATKTPWRGLRFWRVEGDQPEGQGQAEARGCSSRCVSAQSEPGTRRRSCLSCRGAEG